MSDSNKQRDINNTPSEGAKPEDIKLNNLENTLVDLKKKVEQMAIDNRTEATAFVDYLKQVQREIDAMNLVVEELKEKQNLFTVTISNEVEAMKIVYESSLNKSKEDLLEYFNQIKSKKTDKKTE